MASVSKLRPVLASGSDAPIVYTVREVAELLKVSVDTVYGAMRNGKLKTIKIGTSTRVHAQDLDSYIESLRT